MAAVEDLCKANGEPVPQDRSRGRKIAWAPGHADAFNHCPIFRILALRQLAVGLESLIVLLSENPYGVFMNASWECWRLRANEPDNPRL